jgi:hypothetical protein
MPRITRQTRTNPDDSPVRPLAKADSALMGFLRANPEAAKTLSQGWQAMPDLFLEGLVRGACADVVFEYGPNTGTRAANMLSAQLASQNLEPSFHAAYASGAAFFALTAGKVTPDPGQGPDVSFDIDLPDDVTPDGVNDFLRTWAETKDPVVHLAFDPTLSLPAADLRPLALQVEEAFSEGKDPDPAGVLLALTSILLVWREMEQRRATAFHSTHDGLRQGDIVLWPGFGLKFEGHARLLDRSTTDEPRSTQTARVSWSATRH